ncbi:MAG: dihydropteroate synthase [Candidatus Aerophobetes bacterium]|nr:dihydropteroate synthase [Candidatus Aerophobetes bacterium]
MIFVGERINGGFKDIQRAIKEKDASIIQRWAKIQSDAGADYLDVNMGAASNKIDDFIWMIETVQETVEIPISIDSNKPAFIEKAIKVCKHPPIINSTTADKEKLDQIIPLVVEHNAGLIGLCMDKKGAPQDVNRRVELGATIFSEAIEKGLSEDRVFLDPVTMPLKFLQEQADNLIEAVRQFTLLSSPPPHIISGLSNISSKAKEMRLINRIFLVMCIEAGLDAVICDVTDEELVNSAITAEVILNKHIYSDLFIKAYKESRSK